MNKKWGATLVVAAVVLAGGIESAVGQSSGNVGLTAKLGTLGPGLDLTVGLTRVLNARFGVSAVSFDPESFGVDISDTAGDNVDIEADVDLQTIAALLEWYPADRRFRACAGVMLSNSEVDITADGGTITLGERDYPIQSLSGSATFSDVALYVGIGFGNAVGRRRHWHFVTDLGLLFQGAPDVEIDPILDPRIPPHLLATVNDDVRREEEDIEDDFSWLIAYPVASLGIAYRF